MLTPVFSSICKVEQGLCYYGCRGLWFILYDQTKSQD